MMKQLLEKVDKLVEDEYALASKNHGPRFHSPHEAFAVILEEVEEAKDEISSVNGYLVSYWFDVKRNDPNDQEKEKLRILQDKAKSAAAECIQVAAMAHKAMQGYEVER